MQESDERVRGTGSSEAAAVKQQLASDIQDFINKYNKQSYGIRLLATKADVTEKTVKRLMGGENKASYATLFQLYCFLTSSTSHDELVEKVPEVIKKVLIKKRPTKVNEVKNDQFDFFKAITEQPLVGEIYVMAATQPLDRNRIVHNYGQFGLEVVHLLLEHDLLRAVDKNTFTVSPNGPNFDHKIIRAMGKHFVERFFKLSEAPLGRNTIGFFADSLNEDGYKKWLEIDEECYYRKLEVAKSKQYRGFIPAFTFGATDTVLPEKDCL